MAVNNPIAEIIQQANEAKENGEDKFETVLNPNFKVKLRIECEKNNWILIDKDKSHSNFIITWIGSRSWLKGQLNTTSYTRDKLQSKLINALSEMTEVTDGTIVLLAPNVTLKMSELEDDQSGEKEVHCDNVNQVMNRLYPYCIKMK